MKKFFFVGIISLLFTGNAVASGSGDIKLSDRVVNNLQRYIQFEKPVVFLVTIDGQNSTGWRCPHQECVARGAMNEKKLCERKKTIS